MNASQFEKNLESSHSSDEDTGRSYYEKKTTKSSKWSFIDEKLVAKLDALGLSDYQAVRVICDVAQALGHSLDDLYISRSTIRRLRKKYRKKAALKIKNTFSVIFKNR